MITGVTCAITTGTSNVLRGLAIGRDWSKLLGWTKCVENSTFGQNCWFWTDKRWQLGQHVCSVL